MDNNPTELELDLIGVLEGTDKSSSVAYAWDYLRHYEALFAPWRDEPINFIEIGVESGSSLNVWTKYFSRARIVGIDINPACRRFNGDRVVIETGSQEDPGFLHEVCRKFPPSIVVDDGSHLAHHMVYSFKHLFPMLLPGGLYVVEDLEFQFGRFGTHWTGNKTVSAPDYFLDLARARLANNTSIGEVSGDDLYMRNHIDMVSFIGSAVAIRKKKPHDIASSLARVEQLIQSDDAGPAQLLRLAQYILRHNGSLDHAERAIHRAITIGGKNQSALQSQVEVLTRLGRLDEAAEATSEATRLRPDDHNAWSWLAHVERQRGRTGASIAALTKAASLNPRERHYHDLLAHLLEQSGDVNRALSAAKVAAQLSPEHEPSQRRVEMLESLAAAARDQ